MTSQKARILLVDDHTLILQGIKHVVSQMPEIEKVYTASSGTEAMLLIDMQPFDIYLLDVELPDTNGFELIDKILQKHPEARILVNTMHEEIWILKRLTKASISGAILKSADINELTLAIQTILKGGQYLCKTVQNDFKPDANRGTNQGTAHAKRDGSIASHCQRIQHKRNCRFTSCFQQYD